MSLVIYHAVIIVCAFVQLSLSSSESSSTVEASISDGTAIPSIVGDAYDFIVVGGGTAGCAVARRLAETGQHSVLLLEYGDYPNPWLDVPALFGKHLNEENRKMYKSVQQPDLENRTVNYVVGRQLGGTSGINGMVFNRGSPYNYDEWAELTGDSSWNYTNLLPYFRKLEDYQGQFPSDQHGYGGPITVSQQKFAPGLEDWLEAGHSLGHPVVDPNGPHTVSFTPVEFAKKFGRRVSSYSGYLKPLLKGESGSSNRKPNLKVIVKADVKRVLTAGGKAVAVMYSDRNSGLSQILAVANKEVILSAGVINSPAILMRSGIGPSGMLQNARIPLVKALPVGQSLQDHMVLKLNIIFGNKSLLYDPHEMLTPENFQLYNETGEGPYSVYQGIPGQAFLPSFLASREDFADIQYTFLQSPGSGWNENNGIHLSPDEIIMACGIFLVGTKSRGYLTLNGSNIDADPIINFRFLSEDQDLKVLVDAIKIALNIFENTEVYQKMGVRYPPNPEKDCEQFEFRSDEYWECLVRHHAGSGSHAVATCRMGRESGDPEAVVSPELKVLGFQNLRVADTSVMPSVTNANTQAAAYVIAEKAADMILKSWA